MIHSLLLLTTLTSLPDRPCDEGTLAQPPNTCRDLKPSQQPPSDRNDDQLRRLKKATPWLADTAVAAVRRIGALSTITPEPEPSAPVWFDREWKRFYDPFVGEWHQ